MSLMMWPRIQLDHRKLRKFPTTQRDDEEDDLAMPVVVDVLEGLPDLLCAKERKGLSGSPRVAELYHLIYHRFTWRTEPRCWIELLRVVRLGMRKTRRRKTREIGFVI